jgi:hypothetical protein
MDLERIVVGRSSTRTKTFAFTPTGTPSVAVTRSDGTAVTVGSVTGSATDWTYTIPATSNTLVDTYTETWTATSGGLLQEFVDYIEVTGGYLFDLSEFRALGTAYANTTNYPDATVRDIRTLVEQWIEDVACRAFVPRFWPDARALDAGAVSVNGTGNYLLPLMWPHVRAIRKVAFDGTDVSVDQLATVLPYQNIGLYYPAYWTAGFGNVTVHYEHGDSMPPTPIKRAALALAKHLITPGSADDRAINVTNDSGTYALFQAGVRGHDFPLPYVQSVVDTYSLAVKVA